MTVKKEAQPLLEEKLKSVFGHGSFRPYQKEIIQSVLEGEDVLAVLATGGGKSLCYQLPALLREGLTLVLSPLVSLMKDQVDKLSDQGLSSMWINATLTPKGLREAQEKLAQGQIKVLYVAPERLKNDEFVSILQGLDISLIAVDEAHCISGWGHDFRPSYRKIGKLLDFLSPRPPLLALTATATPQVETDICQKLKMTNPSVYKASFDRPNLTFFVRFPHQPRAWLIDHINELAPSTMVYCLTRKEVDLTAQALREKGFSRPVYAYHAGMKKKERTAAQEAFLADPQAVMVATNAFGMGIDKAGIHSVVHLGMPKDLESYYQEAGRGGRDGLACACFLLFSNRDDSLHRQMIFSRPLYYGGKPALSLKKLEQMLAYVFSETCLRRRLLAYFGEDHPPKCAGCSVCLDSRPQVMDLTQSAQILLSTIYYLKDRLRLDWLIKTVRGSKAKEVRCQGLDRLSTYGLLKDHSDQAIKLLLFYLQAKGHLAREAKKYGRLYITEKGARLLKGQDQIKTRLNFF